MKIGDWQGFAQSFHLISNACLTSSANVLTSCSKQGAGRRVMNWMTGCELSVKSNITLGFQTVTSSRETTLSL